MASKLDPILVSVAWNSLLTITEEMGSTLRRTAFSEAVREGDDFSTGLFDHRGRLVAQGNYSPGHLGAMPFVVEHVLEHYPQESFQPGDSVIVNDSFMGSGHLPDFFMITPAFLDDTLIGFTVNVAHHVDVGGAAPGSQQVEGVTEAYQEGIRVLPVRIVRGGEFEHDLLQTILANVRLPEKVNGDLRAQRNANFVGAQRLAQLYKTIGQADMEACIEQIFSLSEEKMHGYLSKIPDGVYSFEDYLDDYGINTEPIKVAVDLSVKEGRVTVDFSRSSDQVAAGINSYINYTRAYTSFTVRVMAGALLPQNYGTIQSVVAKAREGSFFNPVHPAPSGGRASVQIRIFETIAGALSQAIPHRAMAGFSHWANPNIGGVDDRTGKRFIFYDLLLGGYGAKPDSDGEEALSPVFNCANIPVEVHEMNNPVLIHRLALVPDSGGAGQYRGGCSLEKHVEILCKEATLSLLGDRHVYQPYGIEGGHPGALASTTLINQDGATALQSKQTLTVRQGDIVQFKVCGAGGYGDPLKRDRAMLAHDVAEGYVSAGAARDLYGWDG